MLPPPHPAAHCSFAGTLPNSLILANEYPQSVAGLLALALLAVFAASEVLLVYWTRRRPHALLAWLLWWIVLVSVGALIDLLLLHSTSLIVFSVSFGPIVVLALFVYRSWAADHFIFVKSLRELRTLTADAVAQAKAAVQTGAVTVEPPASELPLDQPSAADDEPPTVDEEGGKPPPPPSAPPSPPGAAPEVLRSTSGHHSKAGSAANGCAGCIAGFMLAVNKASRALWSAVHASPPLFRVVCGCGLVILHIVQGFALSFTLEITGWATAMASFCLLLALFGFISLYHQPRRFALPTTCFLLIILAHVTFCVLYWLWGLDGATSGTLVLRLLLYALGAPVCVLLLSLLWLWHDSGWKATPPKIVLHGLVFLGVLLLIFTALLGILYSWQMAVAIVLAAGTLTVCALAARTWHLNDGFLPRIWRIALAVLMLLVALSGVALALVSPANDSLAAVNGFVGASLSWWTIVIVVFAVGVASDRMIGGQTATYTQWPTVVPSFRIMGREKRIERADLSYVLYLVAALAGAAWCALAAVTFEPMGLGVGVGAAIQLSLGTLLITRAFRSLSEIGALAPYINQTVLLAASDSVSSTAKSGGASSQGGSHGGHGGDGDIEAADASGSSPSIAHTNQPYAAQAAVDAAQKELTAAHAKIFLFAGCACGQASDVAAEERRTAAKELNRLDDALRDEWSLRRAHWAKFYGVVVMGAMDAQAEHERNLERFVRTTLETRGAAEALPRGRLQRLSPHHRRVIEVLAAEEVARQAEEKRQRELAAIKDERLLAIQSLMRDRAAGHKAYLRDKEKEWEAALSKALTGLRAQRVPLEQQVPAARAAAERLAAELTNLGQLTMFKPPVNADASAFASTGLPEELESAQTAEGKLATIVGAMVDVGAIRAEEEAKMAADKDGQVQQQGEVLAADLPTELLTNEELNSALVELTRTRQLLSRVRDAVDGAYLAASKALEQGADEVLRALAATSEKLGTALVAIETDATKVGEQIAAALREQEAARRAEMEQQMQREREAREMKQREEAIAAEKVRQAAERERQEREAKLRGLDDKARMMMVDVEPKLAVCRREGQPYVDKAFPPDDDSLLPPEVRGRGQWQRATGTAMFSASDGKPNPDQIEQGALGDCWFLSALSVLADRPGLIEDIFVTREPLPLDEASTSANPPNAGLYCVRFYKEGRWTSVTIDDYLPTGNRGRPLFAKARGNELWVSLIEKAYASLHGSYSAIEAGQIEEALCDMTAGIKIDFAKLTAAPSEREQLWRELASLASNPAYLLGAASKFTDDGGGDTHKSARGIVHGHAYSVLDLKQTSDGLKLLQLRNPWGRDEWTGKWGDADMALPENSRVREQIRFELSDDGKFWMSFDDFVDEFSKVSVCLLPTDMSLDMEIHSKWAGKSAGGCPNNRDSVMNNPQIVISITKPTDVVLTLTQQDTRIGVGSNKREHEAVGLQLLYGSNLDRARSSSEFHRYEVGSNGTWKMEREVTMKLQLTMRGSGDTTKYVVVPSTFDAGVERGFTLRAFTQAHKESVQVVAKYNCDEDEGTLQQL